MQQMITSDFTRVRVSPVAFLVALRVALSVALLAAMSILPPSSATAQPNPFPREVLSEEPVAYWKFSGSNDGWQIQQRANGAVAKDSWKLECTANDPILLSPRIDGRGLLQFKIRMRTAAAGPGQVFWISDKQPAASEERSARFDILGDEKWHTYHVNLPATLTHRLRLDPIVGMGNVEIDWIEVKSIRLHPLEIERTEVTEDGILLSLVNHGDALLKCRAGRRTFTVAANGRVKQLAPKPKGSRPFSLAQVRVEASILPSIDLPTVDRQLILIDSQAAGDWLPLGEKSEFLVAKDGSGVRLMREQRVVGNIAPLVWNRKTVPLLKLVQQSADKVTFSCDGTSDAKIEQLSLSVVEGDLVIQLQSTGDWESPVVRVNGMLEQGLLAGVEHLGHDETSSSTVDLHGPEHDRFETNHMNLTMPLMAVVTDVGSVAMLWHNPTAQPVFAAPNFVDGAADHRMALKGDAGQIRIRLSGSFSAGQRLEDAVLWAVAKRGGLPELPPRPRDSQAQEKFIHESLTSSAIRAADGRWFHAMIPGEKYLPENPHYFGDVASAMFRLDGRVPAYRPLAPGGSHLRNDAIFFVAGQADTWWRRQRQAAENAIRSQRVDGSYRYNGEFREGHFEDTASGFCARPTVAILQYAKYSGDARAIEHGGKSLEYMKRFRTPRGASVWECPLHAPDLLASALLAKAYMLGYELTGKKEYLELAVHWAVSGVPYVYQWSNRPIMMYATTGTLCATKYNAPVWIGRPVQWMGVVYADVLVDLAQHDKSLDWKKLATGILISAEQQQYLDGPSKGCLADSLLLSSQQLLPYDINPCELLTLKRRIEGRAAGLQLLVHQQHRLITPFPVGIEADTAVIKATAGLKYQVLKDGEVLEIESKGTDRVELR